VRVDSGVYQGYKIPPYYDSLIGKLIVHGRNRVECMMRLAPCARRVRRRRHQLDNNPAVSRVARANPDIANGDYDIHWLEKFLAAKAAGK
jgi:acetyl-CoA carboxylase biotin carboxylase subunit